MSSTGSPDVYRTHGAWSDPGRFAARLADVSPEPAAIVGAVGAVLLHPFLALERNVTIPERAQDDKEVRGVAAMLARIVARDADGLGVERAPDDRFFCVCAGYAQLATAIFRTHGLPARCRVGFATYFMPGHFEDHWLCEYWTAGGWRLLDAQLDDRYRAAMHLEFPPTDVPRAGFLDASTAWRRMRAGEIDPATIGLSGLGLAGDWFAAHSVLRDAAALNKIELLPWETWSIGRDFGPGRPVPAVHLPALDAVAARLHGSPDADTAEAVYREHAWLQVPATIVSFAGGAPREVPSHPVSAA
jgi:hypothetical protein